MKNNWWRSILPVAILATFLFTGCVTTGNTPSTYKIIIQAPAGSKVAEVSPDDDPVQREINKISKSMIIPNEEGSLSNLSFLCPSEDGESTEAFIKIFSALTVADVTNLWNDICVLSRKYPEVKVINLFINSPGGDAFSGLALADHLLRARNMGFTIVAHASGIVASAAVPVFAVCNIRMAAPGTIFMVHETSIWKWPGRETASDIRSQNRLMHLLRERYCGLLADHSKLTIEGWEDLEFKTSWFSANKAMGDYGIVDRLE